MAASSIRPTRSVARLNSDAAEANGDTGGAGGDAAGVRWGAARAGAGAARQLAAGGALPGAEGARSPLALRARPVERGWRVEQRRGGRRGSPAAGTPGPNPAAPRGPPTARRAG